MTNIGSWCQWQHVGLQNQRELFESVRACKKIIIIIFYTKFGSFKYFCYICNVKQKRQRLLSEIFEIELWCNGSTTDFDSVCLGSNPGSSTNKQFSRIFTTKYHIMRVSFDYDDWRRNLIAQDVGYLRYYIFLL